VLGQDAESHLFGGYCQAASPKVQQTFGDGHVVRLSVAGSCNEQVLAFPRAGVYSSTNAPVARWRYGPRCRDELSTRERSVCWIDT